MTPTEEARLRAMISNQANRLLDAVLEEVRREAFERGQNDVLKRVRMPTPTHPSGRSP